MPKRIAMWSGPRNISTTLMRSWGARNDTQVVDEPFYAHYLQQKDFRHHPGHEQILASQENDWMKVVQALQSPLQDGKSIQYQKQMTHHLLPHISLDWTTSIVNVFLIRSPSEMLVSLQKFFPNPSIDETGLPQQKKLFDKLWQSGGEIPVVVDAKDVLQHPRMMLKQLCQKIDVEFDEHMLSWEKGIHATDGVWSKHWYSNVAKSTTFAPWSEKIERVPEQQADLLEQCNELYETLAAHKLKPC